MSRPKTTRKRTAGWLLLVGLLALGIGRGVAAEPPVSLRDASWTWGYVIPGKIPGPAPFVFPGPSSCSLETAATYLGTPNVVLMNSQWSAPGHLERLTHCKRVLCAISIRNPAEAARLSAFSKKFPNVVGAMIDDFFPVEEKLTVEQVKRLSTALKSENPALKLYVVRYTHSKDEELLPYLPSIDVINLWVWKGSKEEWTAKMDDRIARLTALTHKPIVLGLYLHDYGVPPPDKTPRPAWSWTKPLALDILETQFVKTAELLRGGKIEGFIILQNGWLDHEAHRPQVQWTKQYLDWLFQTQTIRGGEPAALLQGGKS